MATYKYDVGRGKETQCPTANLTKLGCSFSDMTQWFLGKGLDAQQWWSPNRKSLLNRWSWVWLLASMETATSTMQLFKTLISTHWWFIDFFLWCLCTAAFTWMAKGIRYWMMKITLCPRIPHSKHNNMNCWTVECIISQGKANAAIKNEEKWKDRWNQRCSIQKQNWQQLILLHQLFDNSFP